MARDGQMVRGAGRLMQVVLTFQDYARCRWIDGRGRLCERWFYSNQLMPLYLASGPRTVWPDPGQLELLEIEREERGARVAAVAEKAARRKAVRSNKIKRKAAA